MPPAASLRRLPGWAKRALLAMFSLGFALVLSEIVLQVAIPSRKNHRVWPPNTSRTFRPRAEFYPDLPRETHFEINSLGLRGDEFGPEGSEKRVLVIGASTTECVHHDQSKTWTTRVGAILTEKLGQKVWSGHAARSGFNTADNVLHAKYLLQELPGIDVLLVFVGVNDVAIALGRREAYAPMAEDVDPATQEKALRRAFFQLPGRLEDVWDYDSSIFRRSELYQLIKRVRRQREKDLGAIYKLQDDMGDSLRRWRENRQHAGRVLDALPDLTEPLHTFRQNLSTMVRIAKKNNVAIKFMTQPVLWRKDLSIEEEKLLWMGGVGDFQAEPGHDYYSAGALFEAMSRFNTITLDVCKENELACIDLVPVVPSNGKIFYDDCHFGQTGGELIAEAVAGAIAQSPFNALKK